MKIIITGVTGGLGTALTQEATSRGYDVVGIARGEQVQGIDYTHIAADLTDKQQLESVIAQLRSEHADFDVVINNAGILSVKDEESLDYDEMDTLFRLNIQAPIYLTSKLLDLAIKNEADVVNVGSTVGFKAYDDQAAYGSSKWGIRGFNEFLRLKFKGTKSRAIGFNPGGFESKIFEKATGVSNDDWSGWMDPKDLAGLMLSLIELPKSMEVSDILVNRK